MNPILEQICRIGIIPVIAIDDAKKAVPLARSLVEGGLPAAEVTFRTCAAEEAMRAIAAEVPEMLLGAGTVLNHEQVDRALAAGAKFIVSPGFNPDTVRYVKARYRYPRRDGTGHGFWAGGGQVFPRRAKRRCGQAQSHRRTL